MTTLSMAEPESFTNKKVPALPSLNRNPEESQTSGHDTSPATAIWTADMAEPPCSIDKSH